MHLSSIYLFAIALVAAGSSTASAHLDVPAASSPLTIDRHQAPNAEFMDHVPHSKSLKRRRVEGDDHSGHDHDHSGHDHGEEEPEKKGKPWGKVIGSSILINLGTLSGVVLIPCFLKNSKLTADPGHADAKAVNRQRLILNIIIPAFATGALLATVLFLILPEAIAMLHASFPEAEDAHAGHDHRFLEDHAGHDDEGEEHVGEIPVDAVWRFGAATLGGFMLPILIGLLFPKELPEERKEIETDKESDDANNDEKPVIDTTLALSILLGDFAHNFCDGIFVGIGFMLCSPSVAWTIVFITLYHEVAQEIADFFLLTKHAGLTIVQALIVNFISGLSVVLGGIMVLAMDISDEAIGVLLSMSSGVYIYIAASECMPRVSAALESRGDRIVTMISFICGCVPIGLTLLNHQHC